MKLSMTTAAPHADAYARFRDYGRLEARTVWDRARGESHLPSSTSPAFDQYHRFHAYVAQPDAKLRHVPTPDKDAQMLCRATIGVPIGITGTGVPKKADGERLIDGEQPISDNHPEVGSPLRD